MSRRTAAARGTRQHARHDTGPPGQASRPLARPRGGTGRSGRRRQGSHGHQHGHGEAAPDTRLPGPRPRLPHPRRPPRPARGPAGRGRTSRGARRAPGGHRRHPRGHPARLGRRPRPRRLPRRTRGQCRVRLGHRHRRSRPRRGPGGSPPAIAGPALSEWSPPASTSSTPVATHLVRTGSGQGLLVGEVPLRHPTRPGRFPVRNRIIAALADILVVVEATLHGGSRITAERALDYGRPVFAVPGSRRNPSAAGCNALLADGALPLLDPSDILLALGPDVPAPAGAGTGGPRPHRLSAHAKAVEAAWPANPPTPTT